MHQFLVDVDSNWQESARLFVVGCVLYWMGPIFCMAVADRCMPASASHALYETHPSTHLRGPLSTTIHHHDDGNDDDDVVVVVVVVSVYNYLFYVVPYYVGLHFTYLDKNLFLRAVGDKVSQLTT